MVLNQSLPDGGEEEERDDVITIEVRGSEFDCTSCQAPRKDTARGVPNSIPNSLRGAQLKETSFSTPSIHTLSIHPSLPVLRQQDCKVGDWVEVKSGRAEPWRGQVRRAYRGF